MVIEIVWTIWSRIEISTKTNSTGLGYVLSQSLLFSGFLLVTLGDVEAIESAEDPVEQHWSGESAMGSVKALFGG